MSSDFLKILSKQSSLSCYVTYLFNESFSLGIFPNHIKLPMVNPVFRVVSKLDIINYRSVSIQPILSKDLEKVMLSRLTSFLDKNKIIYKHRFEYQKKKSSTLAALDLNVWIAKSLNNGDYSTSVFLNFAKDFDLILLITSY